MNLVALVAKNLSLNGCHHWLGCLGLEVEYQGVCQRQSSQSEVE